MLLSTPLTLKKGKDYTVSLRMLTKKSTFSVTRGFAEAKGDSMTMTFSKTATASNGSTASNGQFSHFIMAAPNRKVPAVV